MPTFRYQALGGGDGAGGVIDAPDRAEALRALVSRGVTPTELEQVRSARVRGRAHGGQSAGSDEQVFGSGIQGLRRTLSRSDLGALMRELAIATGAGLPLVPALRTIAKQGRREAQKRLLNDMIDDVEHGKSLSDAMRARGRVFDELTVHLVHAGEVAGRLPEVLSQAASLIERDLKLKRTLLGALVYPAIIACAVIIAVIIVVTVIVPRVLRAVSGQLMVLPLPTRIVRGFVVFFADYWWAALLAVAGLMWLWHWSRKAAHPRYVMDRAVLRVPVLGGVLRDVAVARFTRTLGTLVSAGLPVLQSLRITKGTLGNRAMERAIDDVSEKVTSGRTIAEPLEKSGFFPPLLVQIINLGERSGKLDEMLLHAAAAFDEKTEQSIKLFTTVLPPILITVLACVVGFVVLSIVMPLLALQEAIG